MTDSVCGQFPQSLAAMAAEAARAGVQPSRVAIPADRVDMARTLGLDVDYVPAPLVLTIRPARTADFGYIRGAFAEGHKNAPGVGSMSWRYYKRFIVPELERVLVRPGTEILAAYQGDEIVGWIAFARGRRVDTIHWVHARFKVGQDGPELRRRGIMTRLFDTAGLGNRIAYTFKGAYPKHRSDGKTLDEKLLPWLSSRGQHAAYVPWEEWST